MSKSKASGNKSRKTLPAAKTSGSRPIRTAADVIAEHRGVKFNPWFCIAAFVIPFLLTLIAYAGFDVFPFGKRSVLTLDLNGQYIYYFEAIRDAVWGDGSIFYNWSRNLSGGFMGIIGYYLASPFTLIVILLPKKMILESVMILQMCKVGAAGATFYIYAQRSKKLAPAPSVIFSTMYAMMSYVVIQLINPMWIDGPIFLPLIILGIEYLVDDGRKLNYIIPTALMFIANFYIGFMVAIFVAIYFFFYLFFGSKRKFKDVEDRLKTFGLMAVSTIVVLLCSLIMILPVYNALALGKFDFSEPVYNWKEHLFKLPELIPTLLPNQYYSVNVDTGTGLYGRPEIYCGVLTLVLLPLFFLNKKISTKHKLGYGALIVIMITCMYVKPLNMYWHGGQDPNWLPFRYSFLLSFIFVSMAAEMFSNMDGYELSLKNVGGTFAGITIMILFFEQIMDKYNYTSWKEKGYKYPAVFPYKAEMNYGSERWEEIWLGTLAIGILLAAIYLTLVLFYNRAKSKSFKNAVLVVMAGFVFFEAGYNCYDSFRKIYKEVGNSDKKSYTEIINAPDVVKHLEEYDNGFYRAEKTYSRMVNDNMAYGLKGLSHSSSVMNTRALKFIEYMGYFTQSFESKYEGSNPVADSLLGIKYVLNDPQRVTANKKMLDSSYQLIPELTTTYLKDDNQTDTVEYYQNPNALSIGYMADDDILQLGSLGNDNPFNNLNNFLSAMTGNTPSFTMPIIPKDYYKRMDYEVSFDENQVYLHDYVNSTGTVHDTYEAKAGASDAVVNINLTVQQDGDVYMHLGSEIRKTCNVWLGVKGEDGVYRGQKSGTEYFDDYGQYFQTNSSPIVRFGPFSAGDEIQVRLTILPTTANQPYVGANEYIMVRKETETMKSGFNFYYLDRDAFTQDINLLKENQWQIDTSKSNDRHLEGKITAKDGQVFVTTIPYEPGWTIKIDGKKVDSLIVEQENEDGSVRLLNSAGTEGEVILMDSLIGVRVPAGEHTISMTYTPPGFNLGVFTMVLGIAIIVMFYIYDRRNNPVLIARRKERELRKQGITETQEKKAVQIIKSDKVDTSLSAAKKKRDEEKAQEEKLKEKTDELIRRGKANMDGDNAPEEETPTESTAEQKGSAKGGNSSKSNDSGKSNNSGKNNTNKNNNSGKKNNSKKKKK